jgi:hypothetical protein
MADTETPPSESKVPRASTEDAAVTVEGWAHRAADLARSAAEHVPAAVVVVVGGTVLLAADAFGIGEVLTAGIAGYAAYRLLRRRAAKKNELTREEAAAKAA